MEREPEDRTRDLLAGHVEWVRALARQLAGDAASADDLAQDALVVALRSGPRESLAFRSWIASVMRNLVRQGARGDARRGSREERAARAESCERLVDEVVAGRELAQAVLELDEPYRTTILMRFYEGAPPREIANRLDVPVATVNSRIARALARLRERYGADRRGGSDPLAALAPLLVPAPSANALPALSIGGLVLNAKLLSAAMAAVVAAVLWGIVATNGADDGASIAASGASAGEGAPAASAPALEEAPRGVGRAASPASEEEAKPSAPVAASAAASRTVAGTLLDADGLAIAGLSVGSGSASARANGTGRFAFETTADSVPLAVLDAGWVTVREGLWRASSSIEPVVVTAREITIAGDVVDERGEPIQDARVQLVLPDEFAARFPSNLESSRSRAFEATSDARGRFDLGASPSIAGAKLRALREGWLAAEVEMPQSTSDSVRIVMARPAIPLAGAIRGTVVDERGDPVAEARVFLGLATTTTDERGRFGIELARAVTADRIVAVKAGRLPALMERPREARGDDTGWPDSIELVLGGPPLSIRGVVRDHEGRPRPAVRVSIADPSAIGTIGLMPATAEGLASGAKLPPLAMVPQRDARQDDENHHEHAMNVGPPTAFWNYATTDAEGRFEIGGLADRAYKLRITDPKTLAAHTSPAFHAGETSAEIRLPAPNVWTELRGVLVDDDGRPLAGVNVSAWTEAYGVRARIFGGQVGVTLRDESAEVVSDAAGRFVLRDVPREGARLEISSERTVPKRHDLGADTDPARVEIVVALRCSFEVRVSTATVPAPDGFALEDADGERLQILRIEPGSVSASSGESLAGGKSGFVSASSAARTLVLTLDGRLLRRVPIRLRPDEANVIDV